MGIFFHKDQETCPFIKQTGCAGCGAMGLVSGTTVLCDDGWRTVELLNPGDLVQTLEHGLQPVEKIDSNGIWHHPGHCPTCVLPYRVPKGALGNSDDLFLTPEASILVLPPEDMLDDLAPAILQAPDLDQFKGISRQQPPGPAKLISLQFEADELIFVAGGAVYRCAPSRVTLGDFGHEQIAHPTYPFLAHDQADAYLVMVETPPAL